MRFGVPRGADARGLSTLGNIVADAYRGMKQNENSTMAYKGGHYEKDLLASLGILSVNLEEFGCPKAEVMIEQMVWLETCGNHIVSEAYSHWPKVEVEAYAQWFHVPIHFSPLLFCLPVYESCLCSWYDSVSNDWFNEVNQHFAWLGTLGFVFHGMQTQFGTGFN